MPYTAPHTIAAGELVTVATMNNEWGGNVSFLANAPTCRVYNNAALPVVNNTLTALTFNTERYDNNAMHDMVTNTGRITFNTAGVYDIGAALSFTADNDYTVVWAALRLNGTTYIAQVKTGTDADAGFAPALTPMTTYKFAVADYVEVLVAQKNTSAATNNVLAAGNYSPEFYAGWRSLG